MPRPKRRSPRSFSPSQAVFILERAIAERKLSAADVKGYMAALAEEIQSLEARLASLRDAVAKPVKRIAHKVEKKLTGGDGPFPSARRGRKKRRKAVSPEVAATRVVQGQYLSFLNQTPKANRAKYQKIAQTESREKAIEAMKKALGK